MEIWKAIPHAPQYLCSNYGRVKSLRYDKPLKGSKNSWGGYIRVQLGSCRNKHYVHRLVAECFLSKTEGYNFVNHKDGNIINNNFENLEWCTMQMNNIHAIQTGLKILLKGENHPHSILSEQDVNMIIELFNQGLNCVKISKIFSVNRKTISDIKNKRTWKHITDTHGF